MTRYPGARAALLVASLTFVAAAPADPDVHRNAAEAARETGDPRDELRHRVRLAEAQQQQGRYEDAEATLDRALELARGLGDARPLAAVQGELGNVHVALQADDLAERELSQAREMAREADAWALAASLGNNLANLLAAQFVRGEPTADRAALTYAAAREDALRAGEAGLAARILANEARLWLEAGAPERARALLEQARQLTVGLEIDPDDVLTHVHLGVSYAKLLEAGAGSGSTDRDSLLAAHALLTEANAAALALDDRRASAWAQGTLARVYALRGRLDEALVLARRAVFDAQQAGAIDAELRFQLETARALARLGRRDEAIVSYGAAVERAVEIRPAQGVAYAPVGDSSREDASRAYREMADLLLSRAASGGPGAQADRRFTQQLMERFKADELRDYFQDDCVETRQQLVAGAGAVHGAVVVYPVVLPDRLEILATWEGAIRQFTVPVSEAELEEGVRRLRALLVKRVTREYMTYARRVYDWLVRPLDPLLAESGEATVVFVPDGVLRIVPMSALHDGERFLIERHPVAITPGLELTDPNPVDRSDPSMLLAGLSEAVQGFSALPHVRDELDSIRAIYPSDVLVDEHFVEETVESRIRSGGYGLLHLASHAQVGSRASDSYLVTYDGRIDLDELSSYLRSTRYRDRPIDIVTLSACETAAGDERAALGLSGMAVHAGARSALGSLWLVNDEAAAELMIAFYEELRKPSVSRAAALQHAQQKLIADRRWGHPGYWAAFLLISNWL